MMEMSDLNSLYYKIYSNNNLMEMHQITYTPIINELIPIKPRLQSHCLNNVPKDNEIFSLYHMNSQLSTVEKVSVDAKIVVVGASDVALSFLENLIFNSANYFLIFENITLLSNHGMRFKYELRDNQKLFLPNMSHYSYDLMLSMGLNNWVNVVTGKATAINRTDKYIIVNNSDHLYYDYLFLFCGEQFVCDYVHEEKGIRRPSFLSQDSRHIDYTESEVLIKNLFVLNSDTDVLRMSMCMERLKSSRKDIVVFGKYIGSLSVINALLESDIKGSRINFVENESVENVPFIESPYIKDAVYDKLKQLDIKVYSQCTFVKWKLKDKNTRISKITFQKDNKNIRFKCSGLFWFGLRKISNITGNVLIRSSMKFDGHLVVNNSFETNDEYIFAAGPVAKFNPAYRFDDVLSHIHFSSIEIGTRVANKVGNLFGIFEDSYDNTDMVQPLFVQCQLPGKYNYLHCMTPGFKFMDINTKIIKTGNKDVGYFEMVVDQADFVRVISCYSNNEFPYLNIIKLCGKHLSLFDISKERLEKNSITCFFKYFDEPWARGIYLDKFGDLLNDLAHHRINKHYKKTANIFYENIDKLILKHNSKTVSTLPTYTELEDEFKDKFLKIIENSLLKFVENHLDELPEYAHPLTISKFVDKENMSDFWNKVLYENDCEPGLSN
ncbi:cilia- and flagella-associated protein 61-like [Daktulosphaira vitifoliae]|uniref:cilia- and flagella-associated protein 61-like n=1 Tax=Daktulosphaira vitifoliae TaxID=58002 RepID=UPI0021AAFE6E|nr:cilia- and flagella-associated protein 61-like [Daktulosphaira vitifoliae]